MISTLFSSPLLLVSLLLFMRPDESHQADQVYRLDEQQQQQLVNQLLTDNQQHQNVPGHYEFEMAPKMEPPSVRKPPYQQSGQICPGSSPFDGFSPRDTLCGDLNQGRLPLNPLGQNVLEQTYPFELIKNKTLQFLARALPVLKLEYETIPKVARYLPTNQLLNPTHLASPLTNAQMQRLNHHFASSAGFNPTQSLSDELYGPSVGQYARRRKRSVGKQAAEGSTLTELMPNTLLVVSSAHTSGRIQTASGPLRNDSGKAELAPMAIITTKDGYKSVQSAESRQQQATQRAHSSAAWTPNSAYSTPAKQATGGGHFVNYPRASAQSDSAANIGSTNDKSSHQKLPQSKQTRNNGSEQTGRGAASNATSETRMDEAAAATESAVAGRSSGGSNAVASAANQQAAGGQQSNRQEPARRRQPCADSSSMIASALCHVVTALAEGETKQAEAKQPGWFQMLKRLNSLVGGASDSVTSASHPIWSIIGSLTGQEVGAPAASQNAKSGQSGVNNLMSLLNQLSYFLPGTSAKDSSSVAPAEGHQVGSQNKEQQSSALALGSTVRNILLAGWATNAITKLAEYLVPSFAGPQAGGFARRKHTYDRHDRFVETPASLVAARQAAEQAVGGAANLQQANSKQPPTPCPSVEEFISPTFARNYQGVWRYVVQIPHENYFTQIIQRTSCVRQKCEFTEGACHESPRWVNLLVAEIYYPNTIFGGQPAADPVATSSSSGSIMQAQQQQQQLQQPQIQPKSGRDPLQMTDSLQSYNHNLNNVFTNMAQELNLDPNNVANMQYLANNYNYQLLQRNGLLPSQQAEARSSSALFGPSQYGGQQALSPEYISALASMALQQNPNMNINELINSLQLQRRRKRDVGLPTRNQQQHQQHQRARAAGLPEAVASLNDIGQMTVQQQQPQQSPTQPQQSPFKPAIGDQTSPSQSGGESANSQTADPSNSQVECDGHDKIGCYVVRVYYDWFLVNGSCKCWKTVASQTGASGAGANSNSFLRRIFNG